MYWPWNGYSNSYRESLEATATFFNKQTQKQLDYIDRIAMYSYEREDLISAFRSAPNINSALKGFLKSEVTKGDQTAKFVKSFRTAATAKNQDVFDQFVERTLPRFEPYFFLIARHAHSSEIEPILDKTIAQYADEFNLSFESDGDTIKVTDSDKFLSLAKLALADLSEQLSESSLPNNCFMQNVLVYSLFEEGVIEELPKSYFQ